MWRARTIAALLVCFVHTATAQEPVCGPSFQALQDTALKAETNQKAVYDAAEAARAKVIATFRDIPAAIAKIAKARAQNAEADLERGISVLANAKKTYDAAVAAERPALIARIDAERAARGARQAATEAALKLREQGTALVSAAERAKRGEVVPSLSDAISCEQGDCARITPIEHAAMIAIGAIADTLDPANLPAPNHTCDFTLFDHASVRLAVARTLLAAQKTSQANVKTAEANVVTARQGISAAIPPWDAAISNLLNTYANPAGNSHADELLGMAIDDMRKQDTAFEQSTLPYRAADDAVMAAKNSAALASQKLNSHFTYWADLGRAVVDAAARAERSLPPRQAQACNIGPTSQAGPWVFAISPAANC